MSRYKDDPTFFPGDRSTRAKQRRREQDAIKRYAATHEAAETKRHVKVMRYPSGRWSRGGANRSSNIKRAIREKTTTVTLCLICGGVTREVYSLTQLFPLCECGPFGTL